MRKTWGLLLCLGALVLLLPGAALAVELKMAMYQPAVHAFVRFYKAQVPRIEKATKGQIKIRIFESGTLLTSTDMVDGVNSGVADLGVAFPPNSASSVPFTGLADLPGVWRDNKGFYEAIDHGLLEFFEQAYHNRGTKNIKIVGFSNIGPWFVGTAKKRVRLPAEMKGLKIAGAGVTHVKYIDALGGTGVFIPIMERYESIQRGIVDGCTGYTSNFVEWKWMEPTKFLVDYPVGMGPMMLFFNVNNIEKKVPKELKTVFMETLMSIIRTHQGVMEKDDIEAFKNIMPKHMEYIKLDKEQQKLWKDAGKKVVDEWLSLTGPLGRKGMDIVEKYNAG